MLYSIDIKQTPDKTMWISSSGSLSYTTKDPKDSMYNLKDMTVDFQIEAFMGYCYHCRKLVTRPVIRGYNVTHKDVKRYSVNLILTKFQVSDSVLHILTQELNIVRNVYWSHCTHFTICMTIRIFYYEDVFQRSFCVIRETNIFLRVKWKIKTG